MEFKFLKKLLVLLDLEDKQSLSLSESGAAVERHCDGAMETDTGLDLEQTLKCLLAIEKPGESSIKEQRVVKVVGKCLELVWKYDVYQVC